MERVECYYAKRHERLLALQKDLKHLIKLFSDIEKSAVDGDVKQAVASSCGSSSCEKKCVDGKVERTVISSCDSSPIEKGDVDGERCYLVLLRFATKIANVSEDKSNESILPCIAEGVVPPLLLNCCRELERAGLLSLQRRETYYEYPDVESGYGVVTVITGITYSGRLELARLEREAYQRSWRFRLKEIAWNSLTFVVGAVVSAAIAWLFK